MTDTPVLISGAGPVGMVLALDLARRGVRSLVVAGDGPELEELSGFDEGPMVEDWAAQFEARGIAVTIGVRRDEAVAVFRAYGESDSLVYNARGAVD